MSYKKLNQNDLNHLINIVGAAQVTTGDQISHDLSHDELGTVFSFPEVHIFVQDKYQISSIMKYAYQENIPVTVRGSGTGLVGACVPLFGGILMDTSQMNKIIELDKTNMVLRVEPGVLLLDIYEHVEKENLFYAPDPGEKTATIGGNISTNAGGMRAVKYGVTRDWVRGLEVVLPDGEIVKFGGKVVKNSTGYGLKDLIIGSEGTLGIIVEATLKLIPKPKMAISLLVPFKNREDAIDAAPRLMIDHVIPTAVEFFEKQSLDYSEEFLGKKIPHNDFNAYLLVTYDGNNEQSIQEDVEIASKLFIDSYHAIDVYLVDTEERRSSVWTVRGGFLEAIKSSSSEIDECDVVLPRSHIAQFLAYTRKISEDLGIRIPYFGHVGDGNLHIYFCKDDLTNEEWKEKVSHGFNLMYEKAHSFGGLVSGEHGIGYAKKEYMKQMLGEKQIKIMQGIKATFDPKNILNPGKVI
ncbi:MAG: FAD-binding oxidoreductase [Acholeplasmataceae bacterium]|nr:FAD-binding oxidoreductase [Acholeplasmataceae bacterium]